MNTDDLNESTEDFQSRADETVRNLKEKAREWQQAAKDKAANFARNTDMYVHENPWPVIGVTAALAFALGILVGRRSS